MDGGFRHLKFVDQHPDDGLFMERLRRKVNSYFEEFNISKKANDEMITKSILLLGIYFIPFFLFCYYNPSWLVSFLLWGLMAAGMAGVGMSIMHDSNHGAYAASHSMNWLVGQCIHLIGGFGPNWRIQHNILHHTYPNICGFDDDIDDKAILKLSPHTASKWYHRYQHIYAFVFYAIATLYWCIAKDFLQIIRYKIEGLYRRKDGEYIGVWAQLILTKSVYFIIFIGLPIFIFHIEWSKVLIGFVWMHLIAGSILTVVFQLAHTTEGADHPLPMGDHQIESNWAVHQMKTTVNFCTQNKWISWYVGGLNFQIEHHLFPNICHVHYPKIQKMVQDISKEFGVPYREHTSLLEAFRAHVKALKSF